MTTGKAVPEIQVTPKPGFGIPALDADRNDPKLAGKGLGSGWGLVELKKTGEGTYEGLYRDTDRQDIGRLGP